MRFYILVPFFCLAFAAVTYATANSGESAELAQRLSSCGALVQGSSSATTTSNKVPRPSPGQCYCTPTEEPAPAGNCVLIEAFYNMSASLTVEWQVEWKAWIQEMENTILVNASLSDDQKVLLISLSLNAFFSKHVEIYNVLSYEQIADWGFVIDFLYISVYMQIQVTESIVTIGASGSCTLLTALESASASGSTTEQKACASLIVEIRNTLESSISYEMKLSNLYVLITSWCSAHAELASWLLTINIEGYGSLQSLVYVCQTYHQITTLSVAISGNSTSNCVLLQALQEASTNSSFTAEQQQQLVQLLKKVQVEFSAEVSLSVRLQYISSTCYQMFKLEAWMVKIVESVTCAEWGSIYDIIFCSGICTNTGCGDINNPNGTPPTCAPAAH